MSSRQEEKERRRQERIAAEEAHRRQQGRAKRLRLVMAGALAVLIVAGAAFAVASSSDDGGGGDGGPSASLPAQREEALIPAARAAGCKLAQPPIEGSGHVSETVRYKTNPPTSGSHDPVAAQDGLYAAGNPPDGEQSVHALEHGRINIQYPPGLETRRVDQLETLYDEEVKGQPGYHTLVFENQTRMDGQVAATGWGRSLTCPQFNDRVFDAVRAFRNERVDKGPEFIP